jgi:hypothetical protein
MAEDLAGDEALETADDLHFAFAICFAFFDVIESRQVISHRPADDLFGKEIEHGGQIEPSFSGWLVSYVGQPNLIGPAGGEILAEPVGGNRQIVMAVRGACPEPPRRYCAVIAMARRIGIATVASIPMPTRTRRMWKWRTRRCGSRHEP